MEYIRQEAQKKKQEQEGNGKVHHLIAFSGGVDSSVVAALVYRAWVGFDNSRHHEPNAVLGVSPSLSKTQYNLARDIAQGIGIVRDFF